MRRYACLLLLLGLSAGCTASVNVHAEREALMKVDREWSAATKDVTKFVSYYAPTASVYAPGMPVVTGAGPIRDTYSKMASAPGFALEFTPAKADVSASGDIGYTTGTYQMGSEKGKYVSVW